MMDAQPALISYIDSKFRYRRVNLSYQRWFGLSAREVEGRHVREVLGTEAWKQVRPYMEEAVSGKVVSYERQVSYHGGGPRWVHVTYTPDRDEFGGVRGFVVLVVDRGERMWVDQELRAGQERIRQAVGVAHLGIFEHDHVLERLQWSAEMRQICGFTADEAVSVDAFLRRVHPDDRDQIAQAIARAHDPAGEGIYAVEHRLVWPDGSIRWLSQRAQTYFEGAGAARRPARTVGAVGDITERRRSEESLRDNEERMRLSVEIAALGLYERDLLSNQVMVDAKFRSIMGLGQGAPDPDLARKSLHPEDRDRVLAEVARAFDPRQRRICAADFRVIRPDGQVRWIAGRGRVLFNELAGPPLPVKFLGVVQDITERKAQEQRMEELLRLAERRAAELVAVIEAMPDAVYLGTKEGISLCNANALRMLGAKSLLDLQKRIGELGKRFAVRWPGSGRLLREEELQFTRALGGETVIEEVLATNGETKQDIFIRSACAPVIDGGRVIGAVAVNSDVSERKRGEKALEAASAAAERSRSQLEAVFHAMTEGVVVFDMAGNIVLLNESLARILGASGLPEMKEGLKSFFRTYELTSLDGEVVPIDQWPASQILRGGSISDWELRARRRDTGQEWFFSFSGEPVRNENGEQALALVVARDITSRKRAEEALRHSEERFRTLTESLPHLVWTSRPDGTWDYLGRQWQAYTGVTEEEQLRDQWINALHPDDRKQAEKAWKEAVAGKRQYDREDRVRRSDGVYRWFKSTAVALRDRQGRILKWFGTSTDINDIVEARETLARSHQELERLVDERTAKLRETIGDLEHFSYTITHDMRAPLRAMEAFGTILRTEYADRLDELGKDFIRRIVDSAKRMDHLITDALTYSKVVRAEMELEAVDAQALLRGMLESYPEFQPPGAEIEILGTVPPVLANAAGLTQAFSNLLTNAVKFVQPGKVPRIRIWAEEKPAEPGEHPGPTRVRIWFEDNGIGIAEDQLQRIFVMFQRVSKDYEGTGIGLALVRKVVERMKGHVGVESKDGQGSRFWIELAKAPIPRGLNAS